MLRALILIACLASCARPFDPSLAGRSTDAVRNAQNKDLVRRFYVALNSSDWSQLDTLVSRDYKHHVVVDTGFASVPWPAFKDGNLEARKAFPDWVISPTVLVAEGDYVFAMVTGAGTHKGAFAGVAATGKSVRLPLTMLHHVVDGKLVADWEVANADPAMRALKR